MIVSYRGKSKICFHCNVEGHSRAQCPIQRYKTCYNCGSPLHSYSECYEDTLVTYTFDKNANYEPYCYPKGYKGEENIEYGHVNYKEDVFDYHATFNPKFYTEMARLRYEAKTYTYKGGQTNGAQTSRTHVENINYENIEDNMDTNEDGDRNDWGPPAGQQRLLTNEATTDVQGTNLEKQPKDDQQEQTSAPPNEVKKVQATNRKNTNANTVSKEIPQSTEPTDTHHNVQVVKRKLIISSPPAQVKKSKDVPKKDNNVTTIVINGKGYFSLNEFYA